MNLFKNLKAKFDLPLKFWIVALVAFINSVSFTIIIPILYPYAKQFGLSDFQASLLTTSYAASQFLATPIFGVITQVFAVEPLTQRFNLANILAAAIAGRALVFLLIPVFPVISAFVVLAVFLGIVNSFPIPLINSILSTNSSDREQGEILGINASYLSISNAIGPTVAGLLVSMSYSTPFWVTGVLTLLTAGFAWSLKSMVDCRGMRE
ncbi:MAG: MFS transporter [Coleofasciculaceae cyanobacterium]